MQASIFVTNYLCHQPFDTLEAQVSHWPFVTSRWAQKAIWQRYAEPPARLALERIYNVTLADTTCLLSVLQQHPHQQADTLMLSPIHLAMQRDSFSLQSQVPLSPAEYLTLTQTLRDHFAEDFDLLTSDTQQFWWVKPKYTLDIHLPWLGDYLYANAHAWNQAGVTHGEHAALLRSWMNEMQMLLYAHPVNQAREANYQCLINSLWFSKASPLPAASNMFDAVLGQGAVFAGLCAAGLPDAKQVPLSLDALKSQLSYLRKGHLALVLDNVDDLDWTAIALATEQGWLKKLQVFLPWGHQSVSATYHSWQRFNPFQRAQSPLHALSKFQA